MPVRLMWRFRISLYKLPPELANAGSIGREHAILQTVQIPSMNGRDELARGEAKEDSWREVVLPYAVPELKIRLEHGTKR
jgi:hypothetical protein